MLPPLYSFIAAVVALVGPAVPYYFDPTSNTAIGILFLYFVTGPLGGFLLLNCAAALLVMLINWLLGETPADPSRPKSTQRMTNWR
jgi:hypothetical protein